MTNDAEPYAVVNEGDDEFVRGVVAELSFHAWP